MCAQIMHQRQPSWGREIVAATRPALSSDLPQQAEADVCMLIVLLTWSSALRMKVLPHAIGKGQEAGLDNREWGSS